MLSKNFRITKEIQNIYFFTFLILGIFLLSYLVLYKSFNLGLYGDDWLQLYNLWLDFDVRKTSSFFDLRSYLSPYWPQYIFLGTIKHFWDLNPAAYFYASFLLRASAIISLYFFTYQLSKNKLAALISCILFSVSAAGLETTDWVFNMNTYAGLFFFNLAFTFYLKMRTSKKIYSKEYFIFLLFFSLAIFIVPVRMHGAPLLLIVSDLFLSFLVYKEKISTNLFLRIVTVCLIMFTFFKAGSYGVPEYSRDRLVGGIILAQHTVSSGQLDFLFYFFATVGHIIFPDSINFMPITNFLQSSLVKNIPFNFVITIILILSFCDFWIYKNVFKNKRAITTVLIFNIILLLIGMFVQSNNPNLPLQNLFSILLGAHLFVLGLWIFLFRNDFSKIFVVGVSIPILWVSFFTIVYWLYAPNQIIETTGRYLLFGSVGISIFIAILTTELMTRMKTKKSTGMRFFDWLMILTLLLIPMLTHMIAGQTYLQKLEKNRNQEITKKTWDTIVREIPRLDPIGPSVFYLTTNNPDSLFGVLTFGFWPRAGVIYKIEDPQNTPIAIEDYPTLLKAVQDGSPLKEIHARKKIPVPLQRVYAYDFRDGELINKTEEIRIRLSKDLKASGF